MKVFVLTHYLDNGEEYPEDRMTWEEHYYFSSEEMLCASYSLVNLMNYEELPEQEYIIYLECLKRGGVTASKAKYIYDRV